MDKEHKAGWCDADSVINDTTIHFLECSHSSWTFFENIFGMKSSWSPGYWTAGIPRDAWWTVDTYGELINGSYCSLLFHSPLLSRAHTLALFIFLNQHLLGTWGQYLQHHGHIISFHSVQTAIKTKIKKKNTWYDSKRESCSTRHILKLAPLLLLTPITRPAEPRAGVKNVTGAHS